jgi:hypothetical protein
MTATNPNMIFKLREAARVERDELIKWNLKTIADELDHACTAFAKDQTTENLMAVNCHWSHGVRILGYASKTDRPGGNGAGLKEGALLQAAA